MSVTAILALVCIVLGLGTGFFDWDLKISVLEWFVLAIALELLPFGVTFPLKRQS